MQNGYLFWRGGHHPFSRCLPVIFTTNRLLAYVGALVDRAPEFPNLSVMGAVSQLCEVNSRGLIGTRAAVQGVNPTSCRCA